MTRPELLLDVIGEAQDAYLEELDNRIAEVKKKRKRLRAPLIAACLCLVLFTGLFGTWSYLTGGTGGRCNYAPDGIAAGGYFYYEVPGNGIYRYTPGEGSVRLTRSSMKDRLLGEWYVYTANDYGFYYAKGNWIYRIKHGETASEKLWHFEEKASNLYLYPAGANDIAAQVFYEGVEVGFFNELFIIDGITGERKTTIIDDRMSKEEIEPLRAVLKKEEPGSSAYEKAFDALLDRPIHFAPRVTYTVGDRTLELVLEEGKDWYDYAYRLTENGERLTEEYIEPYDVRAIGDSLAFVIGRDGSGIGYDVSNILIVHPDGRQQKVRFDPMGDSTLGGREYCFTCLQWYGDGEKDAHTVSAIRINNVETFELKWDAPDDWIDGLYSDDEYLWLTTYDRIACYRIVYENGVPTELVLYDDNICE